MVPGPPQGNPARPWRRLTFVSWALGSLVLVVAAMLIAASLITVPYVIISPGSTYATNDRLSIGAGPTVYPPKGVIDFVTVSEDDDVSALQRFQAERNPDDEVVPRKQIFGDQTRQENAALQQLAMRSSKDTAAIAALKRLGFPVTTEALGALLVDVSANTPAATAKLLPGDTITAADGEKVPDQATLRTLLGAHKPGDKVNLTVQPPQGDPTVVPVTLGENPEKAGSAFLGVSLSDNVVPKLPFDVTIKTDDVGGPSAGLAFSLAVIDRLTDGELTGGGVVAVTGTITADGAVGAIGGIAQKVVTVEDSGAKVFLVPADHDCGKQDGSCNFTEAKAKAGGKLTIVPVATLDEALAALAQLGGNGLTLPNASSSAASGG